MAWSLRSLSDHEILTRAETIAARNHTLTLTLLLHLNEIEHRRLYLKRGYGSMFDYCTSCLHFSESAAIRRIKTARCLARFPQLYGLLESGDVNLSTVSQVARIIKQENGGAIFARIRGKSQREVEAIVAEYEPCAALPADRVRTVFVPVSTARGPASASAAAPRLPGEHTDEDLRSGGRELASKGGPQCDTPDTRDRDLSPAGTIPSGGVSGTVKLERRAFIQFSARETVMAKLERVRSIASHRLPANAPLEQVVEFLADYFTAREDPAARHERREARKHDVKPAPATPVSIRPSPRSEPVDSPRQIPARVRDEVFVRDKGRCTYVGTNGRRCESAHVLQVDHIQPVARGGGNTLDNLRLLCAHHNRLEAERLMGRPGPRGLTARSASAGAHAPRAGGASRKGEAPSPEA